MPDRWQEGSPYKWVTFCCWTKRISTVTGRSRSVVFEENNYETFAVCFQACHVCIFSVFTGTSKLHWEELRHGNSMCIILDICTSAHVSTTQVAERSHSTCAYLVWLSCSRKLQFTVFFVFKIETKVLLIKLLQAFVIDLDMTQSFDVVDKTTLSPKDGVKCQLRQRNVQT